MSAELPVAPAPALLRVTSAAVALLTAPSADVGAQRSADATPGMPWACSAPTVRDTGLVDDAGRAVYVEPQALVPSGNRVLLVGTPVYVFRRPGELDLLIRDSLMGVVLEPSGRTKLLAPPIAGRLVHDVRAAAAARAGEWAVAFAEAEPVARPKDDPQVRAYWFGVTDGARWRSLTRHPVVEGMAWSIQASALVRTAHGFALAVPVDRSTDRRGMRHDALVLEWDGRRVASHLIETRGAGYVALAADAAGGLILGVVRTDPAEMHDENSLFVYARAAARRWPAPPWRPLPRLVRGLGQPVHDPLIDATPDGVVVSWRAEPPGAPEARAIIAASLGGAVPPAPLTLGAGVEQVMSVPTPNGPVWVLAIPPAIAGLRLRVVTRTAAGVATVLEAASPFTRPIAAAWAGGRLLLTSGVASYPPAVPSLQSRVLSIACAAEPRPEARPRRATGHGR